MRSLNFTKAKTSLVIAAQFKEMLLLFAFLLIGATVSANCDAAFSSKDYSGPSPAAGGVTFTNISTGSYTDISWDFGDGNFSSVTDVEIDHFYASPGNYNVCMYIWDGNECNDSFCEMVTVNFSGGGCANNDCVYPGDANLDGSANFYDIMTIGLGIGANGPPRPNASTDFFPQPAPDWVQTTPDGINYKHLDCDGDGTISSLDIDVLLLNYNPMQSIVTSNETDGPPVFVKFEQDTVYVTSASPQVLNLTAHLIIGRPNSPASDLHGMAIYFRYDPSRIVPTNGINIEYNDTAFLGGVDEVESGSLNLPGEAQLDFGATRAGGVGVNGFGVVATLSLDIIITDIIDGRTEPGEAVDFQLPIGGVKLIGGDGKEKEIQLNVNPATVVFIKQDGVTSVNEPGLESRIKVFPNPASERLYVELSELEGTVIELFDIYGQRISEELIRGNTHELQLNGLSKGLYLVNIHTTEGVVSKRIVVR